MRRLKTLSAVMGAALLAGCATSSNNYAMDQQTREILATQMAGRAQTQGSQLDQMIEQASQYPLGSQENPVRASMPPGQRAYLARLRCGDGSAPEFRRTGNLGPGVYGNIVDNYAVICSGRQAVSVVMDMYHQGYVEDRPVPLFTIVGQ